MSKNLSITLDLCGMPCPAPLLGAKKILDDLQPGQTMCLLSDCPGTNDDLTAWCKYTGNQLVSATRQSDGKVAYHLLKAGNAVTTPIVHVTLDMRGVSCPGPIIEARKLLDGMKHGEVLQLVTDCTAAIDEIRSWTSIASIELLAALPMARDAQEFYLKRR